MNKLKNSQVRYNKCNHIQEKSFNIETMKDVYNYEEVLTNGINDYCNKCKKINEEYGMIKTVFSGDYDRSIIVRVFNHTDIKKVIRYCYLNNISLHDEEYPINSMYDCTGKCHLQWVEMKKGKKVITLKNEFHYDL